MNKELKKLKQQFFEEFRKISTEKNNKASRMKGKVKLDEDSSIKLVEYLKQQLNIKSAFGACCNRSLGLFELIFRSDEGARRGTIFIDVDGKVAYFSKVVVTKDSGWRVYNDFFKVLEFVSQESFAPYFVELYQIQPKTLNHKYLSLRREINEINTTLFRIDQAFKSGLLEENAKPS